MTDEAVAPIAVDGTARYTLLANRVRVERGERTHDISLDDPADPGFLRLPPVDLADGRSLRRAAFDVWSDHVRAVVAAGREFATTYHAPRPLATALAIGGATVVTVLCALLLWTWALRPARAVTIEPTTVESFGIVVAVAIVVAIIVLSVAALSRAWRCRRGTYAHLGAWGVRTAPGARAQPLSNVTSVRWHSLVRCTQIQFCGGGPGVWVPAEPGALRRFDLLVAAMDDRLGAVVRASL